MRLVHGVSGPGLGQALAGVIQPVATLLNRLDAFPSARKWGRRAVMVERITRFDGSFFADVTPAVFTRPTIVTIALRRLTEHPLRPTYVNGNGFCRA